MNKSEETNFLGGIPVIQIKSFQKIQLRFFFSKFAIIIMSSVSKREYSQMNPFTFSENAL